MPFEENGFVGHLKALLCKSGLKSKLGKGEKSEFHQLQLSDKVLCFPERSHMNIC